MNFYQQAANILERLSRHEGTIKALTIGDDTVNDKKRMYALVCETLKYKDVIKQILEKSKFLELERKTFNKLSQSLVLVLIHDLLFCKHGIQASDGLLKQAILRHKTRLNAELVKIKIKAGAKTNEDLINQKVKNTVCIPRYVRVNTLKTTVLEVLDQFKKEGYKFEPPVEDINELSPRTVRIDFHLPDLLVFPPNTDLHDHSLYHSGHIILQDKASCFPAHICMPPHDAHIIDACAAPGNKTSHLSALLCNTGKIFAFDLDRRRLDLLKKMTNLAGCKNIEARHLSFLEVNPLDPMFGEVEYLLLDPSCSGSGIISRLDHLIDNGESDVINGTSESLSDRLRSLSEFQLSIILHAMKFPSAKRIVYSTCSTHAQENEHVVRKALESTSNFVLAPRAEVLPNWRRRGIIEESLDNEMAESVIRSVPGEDFTNGFFVACFMRRDRKHRRVADTEDKEGNKIEKQLKISQEKNKVKKKKNKNKKRKEIKEEIMPTK